MEHAGYPNNEHMPLIKSTPWHPMQQATSYNMYNIMYVLSVILQHRMTLLMLLHIQLLCCQHRSCWQPDQHPIVQDHLSSFSQNHYMYLAIANNSMGSVEAEELMYNIKQQALSKVSARHARLFVYVIA